MLLVAFIVGSAVALNVFTLSVILTSNVIFSGFVGFMGGFIGGIFSMAFTYIYPSMLASKKRRAVEESLPYALSFMGVLSSAGVPPKRVMRSLAQLEQAKIGLGGEATVMYRDMELLGGDLVSVLKEEAAKNISSIFSGILEGFNSTVRSGGDLSVFFQSEARDLMRLRRGLLKEFQDVLVMISEMYMALMVAFPLILIVMLVVMSSIGGGTIGATSPETLVPLIVYLMVPGAGLTLLLLLDSLSPG